MGIFTILGAVGGAFCGAGAIKGEKDGLHGLLAEQTENRTGYKEEL